MVDWKPGTSIETLRIRAQLLAGIREFFAAKNVLEVETPLLSHAATTDVYIQSLAIEAGQAGENAQALFLQTSPEFAMKRLLCAGAGPIYQICKAFRAAEVSRTHNPEFTMLEWYQPGYSEHELMDELEELLSTVLEEAPIARFTYSQLFQDTLGIDPHQIGLQELIEVSRKHMEVQGKNLSKTDYLQLLMANCIEPKVKQDYFVYDFPVEQSALAAIANNEDGIPVARRFELFYGGMEIANGYFELTDGAEQRQRFDADLQARRDLQLGEYPIDERLLAALDSGMPHCAGVAMGIDRLLMLRTGATDIDKIISFSADRI